MIRSLLLAAALVCSSSLLFAQDAAPTPEPKPPLVQATATDDVKALAGRKATVEGKITRIGATESGGITFLNFGGGANAFVAVVFKSSYAAFPDGFDKYKGQTVRVTGPVAIYKETTPQIVVKAPEQIEIVPTPDATPTATPTATPAN
jgi:DNA/RNA endonuclease YhcR with UshA esterase domain